MRFGDFTGDGVPDDLIRIEPSQAVCEIVVDFSVRRLGPGTFTGWVSTDGESSWIRRTFRDAGRFGVAPGGGILFVDRYRKGRFFSSTAIAAGSFPEWTRLYADWSAEGLEGTRVDDGRRP